MTIFMRGIWVGVDSIPGDCCVHLHNCVRFSKCSAVI